MRFDVRHDDLLRCRHGDEGGDLFRHHRTDDLVRQRKRPAAEALPIDIARMRANGDAMGAGCANGSRHRVTVAGVPAACDIHGCEVGNQREFGLERGVRRALADVRIQVDPHGFAILGRMVEGRRVAESKGRRIAESKGRSSAPLDPVTFRPCDL
jgi:hypothetical protein